MGFELSKPVADLMDEFLEALKSRVNDSTYNHTASNVRCLCIWLDEEDLGPCELTIADAMRYQAWRSARAGTNGKSLTTFTLCRYLISARQFYDYLVQTKRMKTNPFREIKSPREPKHLSRNVLTEAQMGRLLRELSRFDESPAWFDRRRRYRTHVIAEFLYATGLRSAEASALKESDIDLGNRIVYVRDGKGGKNRTAFLTSYAVDVLARYLKQGRSIACANYAPKHPDTVFAGGHGMMDKINKELKEVCVRLELPVITSHGFRHSLGTHLLRSGCDMRYIQAILGHESLEATQVYTHLDADDLKRSLDEFHPRQWKAK